MSVDFEHLLGAVQRRTKQGGVIGQSDAVAMPVQDQCTGIEAIKQRVVTGVDQLVDGTDPQFLE